ncbi:conjugal transfer protein, putative [Babesia ovata]|uniref:Conjugal transfer protein, putative n=1 Tax=Babesia ovata TaxID=189622 RepID=A0A2H6K6F6_9APIC|nr:conjugal transfer protein, putative [Babesia ovata]GBE58583.1 conjugal transfer protein, putative [Babesia ovata]
MESHRKGPKTKLKGSRSKSANQDAAASERSTEQPAKDRQMVPFFGDGEIDNTACVALKKGYTGPPRRRRRSRMPSTQDSPLPLPNGREVGVSSLPIGQLSLHTTKGSPINVDLAHLKTAGVSVSRNATIVDLSDKMSDHKNDRNSEKLGSTCTILSSVETTCGPEYESCNELLDTSGSCSDVVVNPSNDGRANPQGGASRSTQDKAKQLINMLRACTGKKKDTRASKKVTPPEKTKAKTGKATAYVVPRYLCSPDPSSIPLPGLG